MNCGTGRWKRGNETELTGMPEVVAGSDLGRRISGVNEKAEKETAVGRWMDGQAG